VWLDAATVANLLLFTFLNGVLGVLQAPAWQAVVPQLVPPQSLQGAIAANSVGINISRAVGPALGRMILARFGLAVPFFVNAVSYLGMVGVLFCWRPPQQGRRHLPVEQFGSAIRTGFRHARNNPHLQATMIRGAAFFLFATAYWALLPLIAREQIAGGPELYGVILGVIGVGAVGGAFALRWMESKLGADWLVAAGTIGTVIAMVLFAVARGPVLALSASIIAGAAWTMAVATLNVSAQVALPDWVRGRNGDHDRKPWTAVVNADDRQAYWALWKLYRKYPKVWAVPVEGNLIEISHLWVPEHFVHGVFLATSMGLGCGDK
jgi:MFS family permease